MGLLAPGASVNATADLPVVLISAAPPQRPAAFPQGLEFDTSAMKPLSEAQLARILDEVLRIEWEYGDETPVPGDRSADTQAGSTSIATACSTEAFAQFRDMVALGQLMAIQQWVRNMADQHPEHADLWQDLARLCISVDLPGLQRIAHDCIPSASTQPVATP